MAPCAYESVFPAVLFRSSTALLLILLLQINTKHITEKRKKKLDKINRTVLYVMKERLCNESVKLFDKSVRKEQSKWSESWTKLVTTHILSESALITHLLNHRL